MRCTKRKLLVSVLLTVTLIGWGQKKDSAQALNKEIILRSEAELWNRGNLAAADKLYSPGYVSHFPAGIEWRGLQGIKNAVSSHRTSFPDWHEIVDDIVAEGDRVAIRITSSGTQRGEFMGLPPSGRKVIIQEFHIFRLENGRIAEQWGMPDLQGLLAQLHAPGADGKPAR
ncbi:MAG: ester cyclase [Acidobacteriaceae bacterium]|nr:ester cyclase [Acidobacteriaceae bacterium]